MLLRLSLEHGHFARAEEAQHGSESISISVDEDPVLVHGKSMATRKHGSQRRVFDLAERRSARCDQMRATDVQVDDFAGLLEQFVYLLFVLLPPLLVSLQLLVLMLALLSEL